MGHLVNPISYRLYNTRYWNNNWFNFNNLNYAYVNTQDVLLKKFLSRFFSLFINSVEIGVVFVNLKILRVFNTINFYIYIHDSFLDLLSLGFKRNRWFLRIRKKLNRRFYSRYVSCLNKSSINKNLKYKSLRKVRRNYIVKYARKFFFLFIKNKVLKSYWDIFKGLFTLYLDKFLICNVNKNIFILGLSKKIVNSNMISEFFYIRLKQYYTIWEVLKNVNFLFKFLMRQRRVVKGYRITCSGRFSRKQRATYSWRSFGSLSLSTMKSKLDYGYTTIALKYSSCTIKVWIRLANRKGPKMDFIV